MERLVIDQKGQPGRIGAAAKRGIDLIAALLLLIVLSPLLLVCAVLVRLTMGSPVVFRQARPGLHGKLFTMYKFRTMDQAVGVEGKMRGDADRLTRVGRFLRATSLDELPELLNILRGEMSLVGPRPLLVEYLPRYSSEQARRHDVLPGMTGWAQVHGRNALTWEEKFRLDVWYVDNRTLWLDIRILARTLAQVLRREGISHSGEATMPVFTGSGEAPSKVEGIE